MTCPICGSGPIFAGNADDHGLIVDLYHPCACPDPVDEEPTATCEELIGGPPPSLDAPPMDWEPPDDSDALDPDDYAARFIYL
jgi:hypothetical protein